MPTMAAFPRKVIAAPPLLRTCLIASGQYGLQVPRVSSERIRSRDAVVICKNGSCGLWIITNALAKVADVEAKVHGVSNSIGFQIKIREASMLLCPLCRAFHSSAP